jgi:hypothetical protein
MPRPTPEFEIPAYERRGVDPWRGTGSGRVQPTTAVEPYEPLQLAEPGETTLADVHRTLAELLVEMRATRRLIAQIFCGEVVK